MYLLTIIVFYFRRFLLPEYWDIGYIHDIPSFCYKGANKYKACVMKIQMACTFLRDIIFFTGPHFGVESDGVLGVEHVESLPFDPNELWLAEGIYYICSRMIVPHHSRNRPLTKREIIENNLHSEARSLIEHVNELIVHHAMFEGRKYRGDYDLLGAFLKITIHMTALYIRLGYSRLPGYGPWSHGL